MGKEVTAEQALSAANEIVNDVSDFGDAVKAEVRHHTGGRRKHKYDEKYPTSCVSHGNLLDAL